MNYGPTDTLAHTREQTMNMEIIGSFDYTEFAQSEIYVNENNKISPDSEIAKEQIEIVYGKVGSKAIC